MINTKRIGIVNKVKKEPVVRDVEDTVTKLESIPEKVKVVKVVKEKAPRPTKGSQEAKDAMARVRAFRKAKEVTVSM